MDDRLGGCPAALKVKLNERHIDCGLIAACRCHLGPTQTCQTPRWFTLPINEFVFEWSHVRLRHFSGLHATKGLFYQSICRQKFALKIRKGRKKCVLTISMLPCDGTVDLMVIWGPLGAESVLCLIIGVLGRVWPLTFMPARRGDSDRWEEE